jgi:hypothetical protein
MSADQELMPSPSDAVVYSWSSFDMSLEQYQPTGVCNFDLVMGRHTNLEPYQLAIPALP